MNIPLVTKKKRAVDLFLWVPLPDRVFPTFFLVKSLCSGPRARRGQIRRPWLVKEKATAESTYPKQLAAALKGSCRAPFQVCPAMPTMPSLLTWASMSPDLEKYVTLNLKKAPNRSL
jgi:hypothetical protein